MSQFILSMFTSMEINSICLNSESGLLSPPFNHPLYQDLNSLCLCRCKFCQHARSGGCLAGTEHLQKKVLVSVFRFELRSSISLYSTCNGALCIWRYTVLATFAWLDNMSTFGIKKYSKLIRTRLKLILGNRYKKNKQLYPKLLFSVELLTV